MEGDEQGLSFSDIYGLGGHIHLCPPPFLKLPGHVKKTNTLTTKRPSYQAFFMVKDRDFHKMEQELTFRIILQSPPPGVDFGLQKGRGRDYEVVQKQRSGTGDLRFEFDVRVKEGKDGQPTLLGPFVQGPPDERFVYLDIGTYAGQTDTPWSRRLKIPFRGLTWDVVKQAIRAGHVLETRVPGTAKDGGPSCATVKPFAGWTVKT